MRRFNQKLDYSARMLLPTLATFALLIVSLLPIGLPGFASFPPDICLMSLYFWTIFRPNSLPNSSVFALGLVRDALMANPLGMSSLLFILFRMAVLSQQRVLARESFVTIWLGFCLMGGAATLFFWITTSAWQKILLPPLPFVLQWIFTIALYPLPHLAFGAMNRFLPHEKA